MTKKLIILSIALLGMIELSHCAQLSVEIPNKNNVTFNTEEEEDSVAFETIADLIQDQATADNPFILAVVPESTKYHYFDASSIVDLYKQKGAAMLNPNTRKPITEVYFFQVSSPNDLIAQYLCSNQDIFTNDNQKRNLYRPVFNKYLGKDLGQYLNDENTQPVLVPTVPQPIPGAVAAHRARERQRLKEEKDLALNNLNNSLNTTLKNEKLKNKKSIERFTQAILPRLNALRFIINGFNNNGQSLRTIEAAMLYVQSVQNKPKKLNTNERRQQFKNRLKRFIADITTLVNQLN